MKSMLFVLMMLFVGISNVNAEGLRVIGRDYSILELVDVPYGIGLATWSDKEEDFTPSLYGQMALLSWEDAFRFSMGGVFTWKREDGRIGVRPITSITALFSIEGVKLEMGGYYALFYNLDPRGSGNDPYGIMIGMAFDLGEK